MSINAGCHPQHLLNLYCVWHSFVCSLEINRFKPKRFSSVIIASNNCGIKVLYFHLMHCNNAEYRTQHFFHCTVHITLYYSIDFNLLKQNIQLNKNRRQNNFPFDCTHTEQIYLPITWWHQLEQHTYKMLCGTFYPCPFSADMCRPSYINFQNFHFETLQKPTHTPVHTPKRYKYNSRTNITKTFFNHHPYQTFYNEPTNELNSTIFTPNPLLYKQKLWIFCVYSLGICLCMILCG